MKVVREQAEILLMEYASGALDQACTLMVASYITLCPEARNYAGYCDALGGALIERQCDPVAMHPGSLGAVMDRLDIEDKECKALRAQTTLSAFCQNQSLPTPLSQHIDSACDCAKWHIFSPGVRFCPLPTEDSTHQAILVRMAPHARAVRHKHNGVEMTLVLEGGFSDEDGQYTAGDLVIDEARSGHRPVAGPQGCICMVVTDAPVNFTGGLYRLLNFLKF